MTEDSRRDSHIHEWFGLTYSHYLVLPRSILQAMPIDWQKRFTDCLRELRSATEPLQPIADNYTVHLRKDGHFVFDPYSEYRHSQVEDLDPSRIADPPEKP